MNILEALKQLRDDIKTWVTNNLDALNAKIDEKTIPIDSELSSTSTNPVQNKIIKKAIDNIPKFSGDYNDLTNAPNITEDESGNMVITDESGNIIFKVDSEGIHTTALSLDGAVAATENYVNEAIANIDIPETDLTGYAKEEYVDSAIESAKEELSESIVSNNQEFKIVDGNGNIIFSVDESGAHTTELTLSGENAATESYVDEAIANIDIPEVDLTGYATETYVDNKVADLVNSAPEALNTIGELATALENHEDAYDALLEVVGNKATHTDLENLKEELSESITAESENWQIVDGNGNVILRVDSNGLETTQITAESIIVNGTDINDILNNSNNANGVTSWNDLEDKPFSSEVTEGVLEFNGDYENYPFCKEYDMTYIKISDKVLSREELLGAEYTLCVDTDFYYDPRGTYTFTVDEQSLYFNQVIEDEFNNYSLTEYIVSYKDMSTIISVSEISGDAPVKLEIGTYFLYKHYGEGSVYVKSLSCLTGDVEKVDKIDPKYLPEVRFNDLKDRPCGVNIVDGVEKVQKLDKKFMPTLRYTDLEDTPCKLRGIPVEYSGNLEDYKYYDVTGGSKIQCFVKISEKTYSKYELANASYTQIDRSGNETVVNIDKALIEEVLDGDGELEMLRVRMANADNHNIVVVFKETEWNYNTFEVGTYISIFGLASTNVKSVSCVTEGFEVLQPLPEEALPDSVATKDYVEGLLEMIPGGGGEIPKAIIDVVELPTKNINEHVFYRVLSGSLVIDKEICTTWPCYVVEELPDVGESAMNGDLYDQGTVMTTYFTPKDEELSGYVDSALSSTLGLSSGWHPVSTLMNLSGFSYVGVIYDIADDPIDYQYRLLLTNKLYAYKDGKWITNEIIGWKGTGKSAEIFNHQINDASGNFSHAEGSYTVASGSYSHAEGFNTTASGKYSHAEGHYTVASGWESHAEGGNTVASGAYSHAEGSDTVASNANSHAEGDNTVASGSDSHAEGCNTVASGRESHAEGSDTIALGNSSHAEGWKTITLGNRSHAEGCNTVASGWESHAEGSYTTAIGTSSHVQGKYNKLSALQASEQYSNSLLIKSKYYIASDYTFDSDSGLYSLVQPQEINELTSSILGKYIAKNNTSTELIKLTTIQPVKNEMYGTGTRHYVSLERDYAHMVGNGESPTIRSNAHTLDWEGNAWYASDVYVGGTSQDDTNAKKLATEEYVDKKLSEITIEQLDAWYDEIEV